MAYRTPPPALHRRLSPPDPHTWVARKGDVAIESSLGSEDIRRSLPPSPHSPGRGVRAAGGGAVLQACRKSVSPPRLLEERLPSPVRSPTAQPPASHVSLAQAVSRVTNLAPQGMQVPPTTPVHLDYPSLPGATTSPPPSVVQPAASAPASLTSPMMHESVPQMHANVAPAPVPMPVSVPMVHPVQVVSPHVVHHPMSTPPPPPPPPADPTASEEFLHLLRALSVAKDDAVAAQKENDRLRHTFIATLAERDIQWEAKVQRERHQIANVIDTIEMAARRERQSVQAQLDQQRSVSRSNEAHQQRHVEERLQTIASKCSSHVAEMQQRLMQLAVEARQAVEDRDKLLSLKDQEVQQLTQQSRAQHQQHLGQVIEQFQKLQQQMQQAQQQQHQSEAQAQMQVLHDTLQELTSVQFLSGQPHASVPASQHSVHTPQHSVHTPQDPVSQAPSHPVPVGSVAHTPQDIVVNVPSALPVHPPSEFSQVSDGSTSLPSINPNCFASHPQGWSVTGQGSMPPAAQQQQQQQQQLQAMQLQQHQMQQRQMQQQQIQQMQQQYSQNPRPQSVRLDQVPMDAKALQQLLSEESPPATPQALPGRSASLASHASLQRSASQMVTDEGYSQLQKHLSRQRPPSVHFGVNRKSSLRARRDSRNPSFDLTDL